MYCYHDSLNEAFFRFIEHVLYQTPDPLAPRWAASCHMFFFPPTRANAAQTRAESDRIGRISMCFGRKKAISDKK